ncbi:hypothetical protein DL93DRAFT_1099560 [Clavulina sp. PMI_390]|nr:hypothetical protein DL93DRAFT_1099560 [Clavulina sp. PMI_390]
MPGPAPRYRAHRQATHRFTPAPYTLRSPHQPASATQESTNQIGSNHELKHASWDPINVAERILSRSKSIVDSDADQEFFLEILQAGVESRLHSLGSRRARILRALQDIAAHSNKLPSRVKVLKIHNRVFKEAGGEATIWHAELEGVGVVLREARPPEDHDWTSPEGLKTLSAIRREIISHIQIQHLNVLPILGISSNEGHPLSIVTPLAMNGNAFRYLSGLSDVRQRADKMLEIVSSPNRLHICSYFASPSL